MGLALMALVVALAPWPDPFEAAFLQRLPVAKPGEAVELRPAPERAWVHHVRSLPEEAPGKQQYVGFLKEKYGYNIALVNRAYGLIVGSFTELFSYDYRRLELARRAVVRDDAEFLELLRKTVVEAARQKR